MKKVARSVVAMPARARPLLAIAAVAALAACGQKGPLMLPKGVAAQASSPAAALAPAASAPS